MSGKKSIIKNYIYNASYQLLNIIAPLITAPYISRVLGAENIGIYSYTASITTYFITLAILGSEAYARREIAYRKNDKKAYSLIFWEIFIFRVLTTLTSLIFYLIIISRINNREILLIQALNIVVVMVDISWFFQGLEEFGTTVLRNFVFRIINILGIFLLVKGETDLNKYVFLLGALSVLSQVSLWFPARKKICKLCIREIHPFHHILNILKLFIPTIAVAIYAALDKTMIGIISPSMSQNGYYEQAEKIIKMLITLISALGFVVAPRIASEFSNGNKDLVKVYLAKSYRFIWSVAIPLAFGIGAVAEMVVPWFYGVGYDGVVPIMKILTLLIPVISFSSLTGIQYLISIRKERVYTVTLFIGAAINFAFNLILIPRWYAIGAAASTVIAESAIAISQMIYVVKHDRILSFSEIFDGFINCMFISFVMFIAVELCRRVIISYTIVSTVIVSLIGIIVYVTLMLLTKDTMFIEIMDRVSRRVKK